MFKKLKGQLKDKLEQGVANTPGLQAFAQSTPQKGPPTQNNTPHGAQKNPEPAVANLVDFHDHSMNAGSFSISESDYESAVDTSHGPAELTIGPSQEHTTPRSRTSSVSSEISEASFFSPLPPHAQHMPIPSDVESEVEDSGVALHTVTKEDLYKNFLKMQNRSQRYKGKFVQVMSAYREVERERDKLRSTLTTSQDKAFRRISELKEQIQLDRLAKQDLEENYQLMLEEKDEYAKVLQTQVNLLKEGKDLPEDFKEKLKNAAEKAAQKPPMTSTPSKAGSGDMSDGLDVKALREKIRRQEVLLQKCKDMVKGNKEKCAQLTADKDTLQRQLEWTQQENLTFKESNKESLAKLQAQLDDASKMKTQVEELESNSAVQIAEAKMTMHATLESKDNELLSMRDGMQNLRDENEALAVKAQKIEHAAREQLEKSRDIIRKKKKVPTATLR